MSKNFLTSCQIACQGPPTPDVPTWLPSPVYRMNRLTHDGTCCRGVVSMYSRLETPSRSRRTSQAASRTLRCFMMANRETGNRATNSWTVVPGCFPINSRMRRRVGSAIARSTRSRRRSSSPSCRGAPRLISATLRGWRSCPSESQDRHRQRSGRASAADPQRRRDAQMPWR